MEFAATDRLDLPTEVEAVLAEQTGRRLAAHFQGNRHVKVRLLDKADRPVETVELPASAVRLLLRVLEQIAQGNAVTVLPIHAEMTTQQAADLLNVSRPHFVQLIDEKKIPCRKVGTHRRVRAEDVLAYRRQIDAQRRAVLDELAAHDQAIGVE